MGAKAEEMLSFVLKHYDALTLEGGYRNEVRLPDYELGAQDYLDFAEADLVDLSGSTADRHRIHHLINCVSHLKRALDCGLDTFLHVFRLDKVFSTNNLKIEKKLEFLAKVGVLRTRTLGRLNSLRNRVEHKYEIPEVGDIEALFDLVTAVCALLRQAQLVAVEEKLEFSLIKRGEGDAGLGEEVGYFSIEYDAEEARISAHWTTGGEKTHLVVDVNEREDFAEIFRIFFLLCVRMAVGEKWVYRQLSEKRLTA